MESLKQYLSPNLEFILCCARTRMDTAHIERARALLHQGLNWSNIIQMAIVHRLAPLLFKSLTTTFEADLPKDVLEELRDFYSFNLQNSLFLTGELITIIRLFAANNISVIPYKGSALAAFVYANLGLRQFGDIDILVHKQDVRKAKELLLSHGYQFKWPSFPLNDPQEETHIAAKYNYTFIRNDKKVTIELHWNVTPRYFSFPPNPEWLWERLSPLNLSGIKVHNFTPEDYLLILCAHGTNHCWIRLSWISDIAELLDRFPNLDWNRVIEQADRFGGRRMLFLGLFLTHELLETPIPLDVQQRIDTDQQIKILARQAVAKISGIISGDPGAFEIPLFHIRSRERFLDKAKYCVNMITPSVQDWQFLPLYDPNSVLYIILRPIRLLIEHGIIPFTHRVKQLFCTKI